MATRIIEYGGSDRIDRLPVIPESCAAQAALTASATSQQSAAFTNGTTLICVSSDEAVHIARGSSPTATANDFKLPAATFQFFSVKPGQKVAVLLGS